jgi:hypothetical protein
VQFSHLPEYDESHYTPMTLKIAKMTMNGRRLPKGIEHRSLSDPMTGDKKNPMIGDIAHTIDMFSYLIPISNNIGDTKDVMAE